MNSTTVVRVQHLITDVDMRPTKSLTTGKFRIFGKLGRGQIALMLNRACTIARFVDSELTIHTMYARDGEMFDLATIEDMVQKRTLAIGIKVIRNSKVKARRVSGLSLERVVKPAAKRRKRKAA
jgi:hypothetical protein